MIGKLAVLLTASIVMAVPNIASADTFYVTSGLGDVYALRVRQTIQWEHVAKVGQTNNMHPYAFAFRPNANQLYLFSGGNGLAALNPLTRAISWHECDGIESFGNVALFASDGSWLYTLAKPKGAERMAGVLMNPNTFGVVRTFDSGIAGIQPESNPLSGTGFAVRRPSFASEGSDLLLWSYKDNALLAFGFPYSDGRVVYQHIGQELPFFGASVGLNGILVNLAEKQGESKRVHRLHVKTNGVSIQMVPVNQYSLTVVAPPNSEVTGFMDSETNEVRLFKSGGEEVDTFGVPLGPSTEDTKAELTPYRTFEGDEGNGESVPIDIYLSSSGAYTVIGFDGGRGYRTNGHVLIRNNATGLWSDPIPVGGPNSAYALVAADWE